MKLVIFFLNSCICCAIESLNEDFTSLPDRKVQMSKLDHHDSEYDHSAILGSSKLDEKFHESSKTDAQNILSDLFDQMDLDKDTFIKFEELVAWIAKSFKALDEEESHKLMLENDANHDGIVTWQEYISKNYKDLHEVDDQKDENKLQMQELEKLMSADMHSFYAADSDEDGSLTEKEFFALNFPNYFPYMHDVELKKILLKYDQDGDHHLSLEEYTRSDIESSNQGNIDGENFAAFDVDKNSLLDTEEITKWAFPSNSNVAIYEAIHLIKEADKNGDKLLSKNEMIHHDTFFADSSMENVEPRHIHNIEEL